MSYVMNVLRRLLPALILCAFGLPTFAADDLEKQLLQQAPKVLEGLRTKGYKNVGILKFRVKKGNDAPTDRAGTLNIRLAEKLELALILANDVKDPIGIIHNASHTAASVSGANHLTVEGRQKLFSVEYPLAWGDTKVTADAFIAGVAAISADLRTMMIGLSTFDKSGKDLTPLVKFEMKPDLEDLLESGETFSVRGVFDKASLQMSEDDRKEKATTEAILTSLQVKTETQSQTKSTPSKLHPLSPDNRDSPVRLEILYDNKPQTIEFRGGTAFVAEPQESQKIIFVVRRTGVDKSRLGVVLKVNGENTLYRQKQSDAQCTPWIFDTNRDEFGVYGYQIDVNTAKEFKVLSQAESKGKEMDYGEFVGTISISVFREQTVTPPVSSSLLAEDGEDFAVLTRSVFPSKTAANLGALKAQLTQSATRGLIADGAQVDLNIKTAQFKADTVPIMTATIRYYNPQDLPPN